jgi:two-component system NtrC family sensor kinase
MNFEYDTDLLVVGPTVMVVVLVLRRLLDLPERLPRWNRWLSWLWLPAMLAFAYSAMYLRRDTVLGEAYMLFVFTVLIATLLQLRSYRPARTLLLGGIVVWIKWAIKVGLLLGNYRILPPYLGFYQSGSQLSVVLVIALLVTARTQKRTLLKEQKQRDEEAQARAFVAAQNIELERLVAERTIALTQQSEELRQALDELQTTQNQLIQAEKMASLGELTAGVAHEIQNPLNFVNNFAEVSTELLEELASEQTKSDPDLGLETELLADLKQNVQKITHHGQRAASIVRGMLEHSRASTGERSLTDLNALCDEYLRLAYHGLRAKDKTFNATLQTDFAPVLPLVEAVSQDLGRVLLNLFTNAFYAVRQRQQQGEPGYAPTVRVRTKREGDEVVVRVHDNGTGIPEVVRQKIFQPFFTTKPAGEGTGLGLSLSYDLVVQGHDGSLEVESQEGSYTEFIVRLPFRAAD